MEDIKIDYHSLYSETATIYGLSVAGKSLLSSNHEIDFIKCPAGRAEDFGIFAIRRGLKVSSVNKHNTSMEEMK